MKKKWSEILSDKNYVGKWLALIDCDYNGDELEGCEVVDSDYNLTALEERLAEKGIKNCIIKFCGEEPETSESPRVTRGTITEDSSKIKK